MSDSTFISDGPATKGLEKQIEARERKLLRRHREVIESIRSYSPQQAVLPAERSFEQYLDPVRSHRRGPLGFLANGILSKLFGAMKIFLRPLLIHQQQLLEDMRTQVHAQREQYSHLEHRVEELKQAMGVQNALFTEQVEMMRKDLEDLHIKRYQQLKNALVEIGKAVSGLTKHVAQQQKDIESLEEKDQRLSSTLKAQEKRVREELQQVAVRLDVLNEGHVALQEELKTLPDLMSALETLKQSTTEAQDMMRLRTRKLRQTLEEAVQQMEGLGAGQDALRHDLHHELQQLREQDHAFQREHEHYNRQYDSVYRSLVFLQRFVGDRLTEVDYEKLYQPAYFEGEMYDDYLNAKGVFEQFGVLLDEQFAPSAVLDLGCAYGFIPQHYQEDHGVEAYGIDISEHAISKLGLEYLKQGDLCDISGLFGDKKFDLILSLETFEHLLPVHVDKALDEIESHSSGYVLLLISTNEVVLDCVDPFHFSLYSREEWNDIFAKRGWMQRLDQQKTDFFNEHTMSHAMKWAGRFWVFDLSS